MNNNIPTQLLQLWTQTHSLMLFLAKAEATHNKGGTKSTRKCDFCGRLSHTIDSCLQKSNTTPPKCSHCDKLGHTSDVCYSKFGYPLGHSKYPGRPRLFNNKFASGGTTTSSGGGAVNSAEGSPNPWRRKQERKLSSRSWVSHHNGPIPTIDESFHQILWT